MKILRFRERDKFGAILDEDTATTPKISGAREFKWSFLADPTIARRFEFDHRSVNGLGSGLRALDFIAQAAGQLL